MTRRDVRGVAALLAAAIALLRPLPAAAVDYVVGPGMPYASVGDVPWESLEPGDNVLIHWRPEPYREKWVICRRGTPERPIAVRGVPGPAGEPPVIDGRDAVTRPALRFWNEPRGVIKIGGASSPPDTLPAHIVIENLEVRSARPPHSFTGRGGTATYSNNAAAIYVEKAEHLTIRNCILHDSGNGLFIGVFDGRTRNVTVEGNWIRDNGIEGSIYEHNSYTAAIGIVFQYNLYGPLRPGCGGNNLKDRSAGLVVRYNWIESGNRQLDLVDGEDSPAVPGNPAYRTTFVYGNILVEPEGAGNSQIVHYGGDSGNEAIYRKGTLYFHNNTVISTRAGNTTLLRLSTNDERADCRNNIVYVTASGSRLAMLAGAGTLDLRGNWFKPGWVAVHGGLTGTIDDDGTSIAGASPGFLDEAAQDFRLAGGSACIDAAAPMHAAVLPDHAPARQYVVHRSGEPRPAAGPLDLGAFEYCPPGSCGGGGDGDADADGDGDADGDAADEGGGADGADDDEADATIEIGPDSAGDAGEDAADVAPPVAAGGEGCGCRLAARSPPAAATVVSILLLAALGASRPGGRSARQRVER